MATNQTPVDGGNFADLRRDFLKLKDEYDKLAVEMQEKKSSLELEFSKHMLLEAAKMDIDINQLFKGKRRAKSAGKTPAKPQYRDPANPDNVWSGRGKPAKWLKAYLDAGHKKEEFKIKADTQH